MRVAHPQNHPFSAKTRNLRLRRANSLALYHTARGSRGSADATPAFPLASFPRGSPRSDVTAVSAATVLFRVRLSISHFTQRWGDGKRAPSGPPLLSLPSPCLFSFHPWVACLFSPSPCARPSSPAPLPPALVF